MAVDGQNLKMITRAVRPIDEDNSNNQPFQLFIRYKGKFKLIKNMSTAHECRSYGITNKKEKKIQTN